MRIAMVTASYVDISVGGVETHVHEMARALHGRGHEVALFRTRRAEQRWDSPPPFGGELITAPRLRSASLLRSFPEALVRPISGFMSRELAPSVRHFRPDVVHFHDLSESYFLAKALERTLDVPLVWTNHLGEYLSLSRSAFGRRVLERLTAPYDLALAPSRELAQAPGANVSQRFVPNGYDNRCFRPPSYERKRELREREGIGQTDCVLLVPRRWAPNKGIHVLAEALAIWQDSPPEILVIFVGGAAGRYRDYQTRVAATLRSSSSRVRLVGDVFPSEMPEWYALADLTVIPSLREATSLSALESLGTGVPVVATRVGGLVDISRDFDVGMTLCEPDDPRALVRALKSALVRGETTPESLALRAQEKYSWEAVAACVESLYKRLQP